MDEYIWVHESTTVDWDELSELYRLAPLGEMPPDALATVFGNEHRKIILYANPGTEAFYGRLGFLRMTTAMAIWRDLGAIETGLLSANP